MKQKIHDKIRETIDGSKHLTQRELAERMGLNPAAVNRMLYGARKIKIEEIPIIENYLGIKLEIHAPDVMPAFSNSRPRGFSDQPQETFDVSDIPLPQQVPVRGYDPEEKIIDWVLRHPAQFGIKDAFACYMQGEDMVPRYFEGELVYIHPGRPAAPDKDCLIKLISGKILIRRLVARDEVSITVRQFRPEKESRIKNRDIAALYAVVGRG